jgi:hypothetical protein
MTVSNPTRHPTNDHRATYAIVGGILAVLLIVMLVTWDYNQPSDAAVAKAQQLASQFQAAGLQPIDPKQTAQTLGEDGGEVCAVAGNGQLLGYLKTRLGVGGEFYYRPTIVKRDVVVGLGLVVKVYCPEKLAAAEGFLNGLRFAAAAA